MTSKKPADKDKLQPKAEEKLETTAKKKSVLAKWVIVGLVVFVAFAGYKFFNAKKQMGARREANETQRQVMIDFWEEQGLSNEEIQLKLENLRQEKIDSGERSGRAGVMRVLGGRHP